MSQCMLRLIICGFDMRLLFHFIKLKTLQMRIIFPAANWCVKINIPPDFPSLLVTLDTI
jgi:hypothetical protein